MYRQKKYYSTSSASVFRITAILSSRLLELWSIVKKEFCLTVYNYWSSREKTVYRKRRFENLHVLRFHICVPVNYTRAEYGRLYSRIRHVLSNLECWNRILTVKLIIHWQLSSSNTILADTIGQSQAAWKWRKIHTRAMGGYFYFVRRGSRPRLQGCWRTLAACLSRETVLSIQ